MKRILLVLFVLISGVSYAQISFITEDLKDVRALADSVALNAKRVYVFEKEGVSKGNSNYYVVRYLNQENKEDEMNVLFKIKQVGYNEALEIEGTQEYHFHRVDGRFLDLFPFWQKFIAPNADITKTSEQGGNAEINGLKFELIDWSPWQIIRRY